MSDSVVLHVIRMAHGGEGIAVQCLSHSPECTGEHCTQSPGKLHFVVGAYPGDVVRAHVLEEKKNFYRSSLDAVEVPSPLRGESTCEAAAAGAGCCDFATLNPEHELELKADIQRGQLERALRSLMPDGHVALPPIELVSLGQRTGWRTRARLGVDKDGKAGLRARGSRSIITDHACAQWVDGLAEGVVGAGALTFTPGSEVIVVMDSTGTRHIVEVSAPARGRRAEKITKIIEGPSVAKERVGNFEFTFPPTAFWQSHRSAPQAYSDLISTWLRPAAQGESVDVWDLYGGVGALIPGLIAGVGSEGAEVKVHSVDYSPAATAVEQQSLAHFDIEVIANKVENVAARLPQPCAVVLDPPRTGAGAHVISAIAGQQPPQVIHIGCDPATFARDSRYWYEHGYAMTKVAVVNAFAGTHHMETIALFEPQPTT